MDWASDSRRRAESCLESARPLIGRCTSSTTAAATTGPASGPRPASSTPATGPLQMSIALTPDQLQQGVCSVLARPCGQFRPATRRCKPIGIQSLRVVDPGQCLTAQLLGPCPLLDELRDQRAPLQDVRQGDELGPHQPQASQQPVSCRRQSVEHDQGTGQQEGFQGCRSRGADGRHPLRPGLAGFGRR